MKTGILIRPDNEISRYDYGGLTDMQQAVGGYIEAIRWPDRPNVIAYCDEEGQIKGLEPNMFATVLLIPTVHRSTMGIIVGPVLITRVDPATGDQDDLDPELADRLIELGRKL